MSATVIIPTTGSRELHTAIQSVLNQTYKDTKCYIVCDGENYYGKVRTITSEYLGDKRIKVCYLPENVGAVNTAYSQGLFQIDSGYLANSQTPRTA